MRTMKVAIYARVSSALRQNPDMQLSEARQYASLRGWQVFSEYVDGLSGATESRTTPAAMWGNLMNDETVARPSRFLMRRRHE
jgi:predicted site-specific integrase-resolvase